MLVSVPDLTPKQAAAIAGVATNTVRSWARAGRLPYRLTAGGHRRFDEATIREWAALRSVGGPEEPDDPRVDGWRRSAEALLRAAIADLGAGSQGAAPFRAALTSFTGKPPAPVVPARGRRAQAG